MSARQPERRSSEAASALAKQELEMAWKLYHWLVADGERQARQDYPLIGAIPNSIVQARLRRLRAATLEDRLTYARVGVKMSSESLPGLEPITNDEKATCKRFRPELVEIELFAQRDQREGPLAKQGRIMAAAVGAIGAVLEQPMHRSGGESYEASVRIGSWWLDVSIDPARRGFDVFQSLRLRDRFERLTEAERAVAQSLRVDFPRRLGFWGTVWDTRLQQDVEATTTSAARCCQHVLLALREIIEGAPANSEQMPPMLQHREPAALDGLGDEAPDSYHVLQQRPADAARLLERAGLTGFVLPQNEFWTSFTTGDASAESQRRIIAANTGLLLHYWHCDDLSWGFTLFDGPQTVGGYTCAWKDERAKARRSGDPVAVVEQIRQRMLESSSDKDRIALKIDQMLFSPGLRAQLDGDPELLDEDPSEHLLNDLGLGSAQDLSFAGMLTDYRSHRDIFNQLYEEVVIVGVGG